MKKLLFLSLLSIIGLTSCMENSHRNHHKMQKQIKVDTYRTRQDNSNDFLFWYIILSNNNSCYSYSSPTAVTNFSTVVWTRSETNPVAGYSADKVEQLEQEQVPVEEMNAEMQADINDNAESFGGLTEEEMGDYEGGTETDAGNSTGESSEGSSDGGGDSGGDSGGGDGGGDGGGGGD